MVLDDLTRLIAIEDIKRLKALYFRALDRKDWSLLRTAFADDVTLDYRGAATDPAGVNSIPDSTEAVLHGADAALATIRSSLEGIVTVHHGHMPEIEVMTEDSARAIWAMFDILRFPQGSPVSDLTGYGHYEETYVRTDGAWKISSLKLTRLRIDSVAATTAEN